MTAAELIDALGAFDPDEAVSVSVYLPELAVWCETSEIGVCVDDYGSPMIAGDLDSVVQLLARG